jgi:hypothetical protein
VNVRPDSKEEEDTVMSWSKPEMVEIKMDAEIGSYQEDDRDPYRDGPHFVHAEPVGERDGD